MDLEAYYNETISVFEDLRKGKVLKKLPDPLSARIVSILDKYGSKEEEGEDGIIAVVLQTYDTRLKCDECPPAIELGDMIDEPWYTGLVEVKGLVKGYKTLKAEVFCYDNKMAVFQGTKKKVLKGQIIFGPSSAVNVGEKKNTSTCFINQSYCTEVQVKFPSSEEARKWFELYKATSRVIRSMSIKSDPRRHSIKNNLGAQPEDSAVDVAEDGDSDIYDALDDINEMQESDTTDSLNLKLSVDSSHIDFERDEFGRPIVATIKRQEKPESVTMHHDGSVITDEFLKKIECKYENIYQAEWDFNIPDELLDIYGILDVKRGDIVVVRKKTCDDWWDCVATNGREGYIASCFLTAAFEI